VLRLICVIISPVITAIWVLFAAHFQNEARENAKFATLLHLNCQDASFSYRLQRPPPDGDSQDSSLNSKHLRSDAFAGRGKTLLYLNFDDYLIASSSGAIRCVLVIDGPGVCVFFWGGGLL